MDVGLWHCLPFRDADAMAGWLRDIGFEESALYRGEDGGVLHAEYLWPAGGGVMFGSFRDDPAWPAQPGVGAAYLVCEDCDALFDRAVAGGASVLRPPADQDYGGRSASVRDPEGNIWTFGTFPGTSTGAPSVS